MDDEQDRAQADRIGRAALAFAEALLAAKAAIDVVPHKNDATGYATLGHGFSIRLRMDT